MDDVLQQRECIELHKYVTQIQTDLFNNTDERKQAKDFNPSEFLNEVSQLRRSKLYADKLATRDKRFALPPLYRT